MSRSERIQFNNGLVDWSGPFGRRPHAFRWNRRPTVLRRLQLLLHREGTPRREDGGEYLYNTISDMSWCNLLPRLARRAWRTDPGKHPIALPRVERTPSTWQLNSISWQRDRPVSKAIGSPEMHETKHMPAAWFQDDWSNRVEADDQRGARYDLEVGAFAENLGLEIKPFLPPDRHADKNNIAPRLGFAYTVTDKTVVRGGFGKFYAQMFARDSFYTHALMQTIIPGDSL
jgi:hypothetical protein